VCPAVSPYALSVRNSRRPGTAPRAPARDRRGRGLRGELAPRAIPRHRTRGEQFDDLVLDAVEELEARWAAELEGVEFAVEDVPALTPGAAVEFDPEVIVDRGVPLGRLLRAGIPGAATPTIVIYRRPVEARAHDGEDRADLIFTVVAELVAELLGRDVDEIDPPV
jgi:predicted Zn-dependent protease with MMP-like domain